MGVRWKILRAPLTHLYRVLFKPVEWTWASLCPIRRNWAPASGCGITVA
jgi:hypothetical protein